jgi:amidophosphoribosyltransferase
VVKDIYRPFTARADQHKIAELLTPPSIKAEVRILFQSIEGLHTACPAHTGDWYFTGDYPTPGGRRVVLRAFINFMQGRNVRAY